MKLLVGVILLIAAMQTFAMPTIEDTVEQLQTIKLAKEPRITLPRSEIVEQFRADLMYWFFRYQNFYDRSNTVMRSYRLAHVSLVTRVFNGLMEVFGDGIENLRQGTSDLKSLIASKESNACIQEVIAERNGISMQTNSAIQVCAIYANGTISGLLGNVFYPEFASIQSLISTVPTAVLDVLSRGNVLQDEQTIIEYLRANYQVIDFQWLTAVSQLLRWQTNRFEVDGMFLIDEMRLCLSQSFLQYMESIARLETVARNC